jgi:hypothetical protein
MTCVLAAVRVVTYLIGPALFPGALYGNSTFHRSDIAAASASPGNDYRKGIS